MTKEEALQQLQAAEAALAAAKEAVKVAKDNYKAAGALRLWRPDEGEDVFFIMGDGVVAGPVEADYLGPNDVLFGNAIRSEAEAYKQAARVRAFNILNRLATEAGNICGVRQLGVDQWVPLVETKSGKVRPAPFSTTDALPTVAYFPTSASCQEAIDVVGADLLNAAATA